MQVIVVLLNLSQDRIEMECLSGRLKSEEHKNVSNVQQLNRLAEEVKKLTGFRREPCGQSNNGSMIVNYDSRGVPDKKIAHIMTLDS